MSWISPSTCSSSGLMGTSLAAMAAPCASGYWISASASEIRPVAEGSSSSGGGEEEDGGWCGCGPLGLGGGVVGSEL